MPTSIHGTNGITFNDGSIQTTRPAIGFRNKIINGDCRIDQRNAGSAVTVVTGSAGYTLDRFFAYQNSPSTLVQVSRNTSAPSGFQNSIKWGRNGSGVAGGVTVLGQALETSNSIDAQGGTVTLSFYAKAGANFSAASSQIGVTLYSGTGTDQSVGSMITGAWTGSATPINSGATLTTSWQRFTFTSSTLGASVSQLGLYLIWTPVGTAGADDNVYITGVQLETGSTATEFERRPIGMELALCQRYYVRYAGDSQRFYGGRMESTTVAVVAWSLPVEMRTTPTVGNGTIGNITINDGAAQAAATSLSTQYSTSKLFAQTLLCGALTNLRSIFISFSSGSYLDASAEI